MKKPYLNNEQRFLIRLNTTAGNVLYLDLKCRILYRDILKEFKKIIKYLKII